MKKYTYFFILLLAAIFWSCEREIALDLPATPQKITIMGVQPQNTFLNAKIGRSRSLTESINYNDPSTFLLTNALVQVFVNGNLTDTLRYNTASTDYRSTRTRVQPGATYKLVVAANGLATAETEAVATRPVPILNITRKASNRVGNYGEVQDELLITFRDIEPGKNYYRLQLQFGNPNYGFVCINSTDADLIQFEIVDPLGGGSSESCYQSTRLLLADDNFNMQTKTLRLFVDRDALLPVLGANNRTIRARVLLQNIPKSYFDFIKTLEKYKNSEDNPFSEPSNVFSNVKNGYGLYVPFGEAVDSIR